MGSGQGQSDSADGHRFLRSKKIFLVDLILIEREYVWSGSLWIFLNRDSQKLITILRHCSDRRTVRPYQTGYWFLFLCVSVEVDVSYRQFLRIIRFEFESFRAGIFRTKFSCWKFLTVQHFDLKQYLWFVLLSVIRRLLRSLAYLRFVENCYFFQHEFDFEPVVKDLRTAWLNDDHS